MQGNVEELIGVDLVNYAIAAAEDCSERLKDYVNFDVLHAIQSKPWVSETPFPMDACMPDLTLLLIDARKLQKYILESIVWWSKVLNLDERFGFFFTHLIYLCDFSRDLLMRLIFHLELLLLFA